MTQSIEQRSKEDFDLLVTAHLVGDPAMYSLLRDRTLDDDREKARGILPNEIDTATRD